MSSELVVQPSAPLGFLPTTMEQALDFSSQMSKAKLLPAHLQGAPADCLRVVMQAARWQMDPFAVADKTSVIQGKLMYEGQLVSAVVNARGQLAKRLSYTFTGTGENRTLVVSGVIKGEDEARTIDLSVAQARKINKNGQININPDQQMCYIGARIWARRHTPELMLGVYADDEMSDEPEGEPQNVTPEAERPKPPARRGSAAAAKEQSATVETPAVEQAPAADAKKAERFAGPTVDAEIVEGNSQPAAAPAPVATAQAEVKKVFPEAQGQPEPEKPAALDTSKVPEVCPGVSVSGFKGKAWPVLITATINSIVSHNKAKPYHVANVTSHQPAEATFEVIIFEHIKVEGTTAKATVDYLSVDSVIEFNAEAKLRQTKGQPDLTKPPAILAKNVTESELPSEI